MPTLKVNGTQTGISPSGGDSTNENSQNLVRMVELLRRLERCTKPDWSNPEWKEFADLLAKIHPSHRRCFNLLGRIPYQWVGVEDDPDPINVAIHIELPAGDDPSKAKTRWRNALDHLGVSQLLPEFFRILLDGGLGPDMRRNQQYPLCP